MSRVILAEDFVRPNRGDLSPILSVIKSTLATCFSVEMVATLSRQNPAVMQLLHSHELSEAPTEVWSRLYVGKPEVLIEFVRACLRSDDVVIGFEMPAWMRGAVTDAGVRYFDFRVSPLRFGSDIYLCVYSEDPGFVEALQGHALRPQEVSMEAHLLSSYFSMAEDIRLSKAKYAEENAVAPLAGYSDALVFIGQAPLDYSKIDDAGRLLGFSDYADEVRRLARGFDAGKLFYKRHPYYTLFPKEEKKLLEQILGTALKDCNVNAYELASAPCRIDFCGISSGLLQEVGYFGKTAHCLFRPFTAVNFSDPRSCQLKFNSLLSSEFWARLLRLSDTAGLRMDFVANRARQILNTWWDYPEFERNKIG
jgi:hypothetical protein